MSRVTLSNYISMFFTPVLMVVFFHIPCVYAIHDEGPHDFGRLISAIEGKKISLATGPLNDYSCLGGTSSGGSLDCIKSKFESQGFCNVQVSKGSTRFYGWWNHDAPGNTSDSGHTIFRAESTDVTVTYMSRDPYWNCNGPSYTSSDGFYTTTEFTCPPGSELWDENKCNEPKPIIPDVDTCGSEGNNRIGNPCNAATGEKVESEMDYSGPTLNFTRTYRSMQRTPENAVMAPGWHHNYSASLIFSDEDGLPEFSVRPDGGFVSFSRQNDDLFYSTHNTSLVLRRITDEWELQLPGNAREYFSLTGKLLRKVDTQNNITRLQYDANERLSSVTGVFGRMLQITYNVSGQIETVLDPAGEHIGYEYDERRRLIQVTLNLPRFDGHF